MKDSDIRTYGLYSWDNKEFLGYFVAHLSGDWVNDVWHNDLMPVDWDKVIVHNKKVLMNHFGDVTKSNRMSA
jgi:hypothetical protein